MMNLVRKFVADKVQPITDDVEGRLTLHPLSDDGRDALTLANELVERYSGYVDESTMVAVPIPAGSCEFHHSLTVHATSENKTPYRRRAIAMSYMSARSKETRDAQKRYPLLRGQEYPDCV